MKECENNRRVVCLFQPWSSLLSLCYTTSACSIRMSKGVLTIWPVYAYTLAAQNTVIQLQMLILETEDNTSMSYEETCLKVFTNSVIIW